MPGFPGDVNPESPCDSNGQRAQPALSPPPLLARRPGHTRGSLPFSQAIQVLAASSVLTLGRQCRGHSCHSCLMEWKGLGMRRDIRKLSTSLYRDVGHRLTLGKSFPLWAFFTPRSLTAWSWVIWVGGRSRDHTLKCSRLTPGTMLRGPSWQCSEATRVPGIYGCMAKSLLTLLSLWPWASSFGCS